MHLCRVFTSQKNVRNGGLTTTQPRKKSTKINFLGPETARWGGGLPREGVGVENFVPSLETLSSLGFEERNLGCPGIFAGMSRTPGGVRKVRAKKVRAHFSFPTNGGLRYLSTIVHNCLRLPSFCDESSPWKGKQKGHKGAQL